MEVDDRASVTWNALGTFVFLSVSSPRRLHAAQSVAREVLAAVDLACSRFRTDSDLARANARPGTWVPVSPLLVAAVRVAVEAAEHSSGLVDPCLGRAITYLGYDADLAVVRQRGDTWARPGTPPPALPGSWREIGLDPEGAVRVPFGCALDLGATAKAWASDLVAASVVDRLECHVAVSLGGDVRIDGPRDVRQAGWPVSVAERPAEETKDLLWLGSGGMATSTTTLRRWSAGGRINHHLLDPRTGVPVSGRWRTATATGATCVAANTATTAALVLGDGAVDWLTERSVAARLVATDGSVATTGGWPGTSAPLTPNHAVSEGRD